MSNTSRGMHYSDLEGIKTFIAESGGEFVDLGYRFGQKVRVRRGSEIAEGTVVGITRNAYYNREYVESNPPTITVQTEWENGDVSDTPFNPKTRFPPDFGGQQFHFEELLG